MSDLTSPHGDGRGETTWRTRWRRRESTRWELGLVKASYITGERSGVCSCVCVVGWVLNRRAADHEAHLGTGSQLPIFHLRAQPPRLLYSISKKNSISFPLKKYCIIYSLLNHLIFSSNCTNKFSLFGCFLSDFFYFLKTICHKLYHPVKFEEK